LERSPVGVAAPRRRGRPRNRDLDAKILDAARSVLSDDGIRGFSLLEVARRAGVPKSTVYRRWRTKRELLAAALSAFGSGTSATPDTGTLRGDLVALVRERIDDLRWRRETLGELGLETRHDHELGRVVQATIERRRHACHPIFERALARGELRAGIDFEVALDLVVGPVWSRVMSHRLGPRAADEIVDGALDGFGATTPPRD
jgi:AcrR family transcriptional regulator